MTTPRPVSAADGATGRGVVPRAALPTSMVLARLMAFIGVSTVAAILAPAFLHPFLHGTTALAGVRLIAHGAMTCVGLLAATALTLRWFGESWGVATGLGAAGFDQWKLFGGLAAGWFAIAMPTGVLVWIGALRIVPAEAGSWGHAALLAAAMLGPAALAEELMFRGYALTLLRRAWGTTAAVALSSAGFGALHLLNAGVTAQSVFMVALAGVFLAIVRVAMESLWAAWLAHFAYNFVQLAVFHTPISGIALPQPLYRAVSAGPDWLTGGAWGPEAGMAAAFGMLVVSLLLAILAGWVRVHRRGWRFDIDVRPIGRGES